MTIVDLISNNTDEVIAITIVFAYVTSWFTGHTMPTEPLMIILGYYFGKKVTA